MPAGQRFHDHRHGQQLIEVSVCASALSTNPDTSAAGAAATASSRVRSAAYWPACSSAAHEGRAALGMCRTPSRWKTRRGTRPQARTLVDDVQSGGARIQIGVIALGAQTFIVGDGDGETRPVKAVTNGSRPIMLSDTDGAQGPSMPSVPCPTATTRQPPGGAAPAGGEHRNRSHHGGLPGVPVGRPVQHPDGGADRPPRPRRVTPGMVVADTRVPGPLPLRSAVLTAAGAPPEDAEEVQVGRTDGYFRANGSRATAAAISATTTAISARMRIARLRRRWPGPRAVSDEGRGTNPRYRSGGGHPRLPGIAPTPPSTVRTVLKAMDEITADGPVLPPPLT